MMREAYLAILYMQQDYVYTPVHVRAVKGWLPLVTTLAGQSQKGLEQLQGTMVEFSIHKEVSGANN